MKNKFSKMAFAAIGAAVVMVTASPAFAADPYLGGVPASKTPQAYLGEGLTTEPHFRLRESVLPVSDELAGKQYIFVNGELAEDVNKVGGNMVRFIDGKRIEFKSYCCPRPTGPQEPTYANYIAFKISEGVYFVTFVEQRGKWREQQLVTFILDQKKMAYTDSFAEDDFGNGELYWMLVQGSLIEISKTDPLYTNWK